MPEEEILDPGDPELEMLRLAKESGYNYRERRHADWDENYELYRDKVQINRLIQRQTVNIPLMKQTIRTLLKDVDDMPVLYFKNVDNDKESEMYANEYWKTVVKENRMDLQDIVDKRQVMLFGRTYDQWQVAYGKVLMTVQDPMDILVDRYADPFNIHSSRFLIHMHIFEPLASLELNKDYDQEEVASLKAWHATTQGLIKASENSKMLNDKNQKMRDLGVQDIDSPVLGETYVELTAYFMYRPSEKKMVMDDKTGVEREELMEEQIFLYIVADDYTILLKKPLEEVIGETKDHFWRNHFPYNSWADDLERQDWYSDSIADIVRPSNKVLNVWFSQLVENRTLRSMGMNFYDATIEGFTPQTLPPMPFGWYPLPGKPQDVYQKVDIPELSESLDEMNFVISVNDRATGATATQQGVQTERQITLGEVQLALGEAKERVKGMSKFYTPVWLQRGEMFLKLVEAAQGKIDPVMIHKEGRNTGNIFSREISPKDWMKKAGYLLEVWSQDEKDMKDTQNLEKISAVSTMFPGNPKMMEIKQRKSLEFAGLSPDQINEIMEFEKQKMDMLMSMQGQMGIQTPGVPQEGQGTIQPQQPPMQLPARAQ